METLETARLLIRPFRMSDLEDIYYLLDVELSEADFGSEKPKSLVERADWLQWTVLNYGQLEKLYQPPYGDRAVTLKANGALIGACGFVPCLAPFEQTAYFSGGGSDGEPVLSTTEFGLFYAIAPRHQRQGYASEAAQALVDYAFDALHLKRIVATTSYDNTGSMGVMRRLGMRIERNPLPQPAWMQVVGILENQGHSPADSDNQEDANADPIHGQHQDPL